MQLSKISMHFLVSFLCLSSTLIVASMTQAQQVKQIEVLPNNQLINTDPAPLTPKQMQLKPIGLTATEKGQVTACSFKQMTGNKILLSVAYTTSKTNNKPVYVGAWVYSSRTNKANVGYLPVQLSSPSGTVELSLIVNDPGAFNAFHIEVFLIQDGTQFGEGTFDFPLVWNGSGGYFQIAGQPLDTKNGSQQSDSTQMRADAKNIFCSNYADAAIAQYNLGVQYNLKRIIPPVWSNNHAAHYDWCMQTDEQTVKNGDLARSNYLVNNLPKFVLDNMRAKGRLLPGLDPGRGP